MHSRGASVRRFQLHSVVVREAVWSDLTLPLWSERLRGKVLPFLNVFRVAVEESLVPGFSLSLPQMPWPFGKQSSGWMICFSLTPSLSVILPSKLTNLSKTTTSAMNITFGSLKRQLMFNSFLYFPTFPVLSLKQVAHPTSTLHFHLSVPNTLTHEQDKPHT